MGPTDEMKKEVTFYTWMFVIIAAVMFICNVMQTSFLGMIGEGLTKRLRIHLLTSVLRQEIGYLDDPAHTPGKLTHALQVYANRMSVLFISIGDNANALAS